jgi:hypothetical protein
MQQLPPVIAARYRLATDCEIRSRSFGCLRVPRDPQAANWNQRRGTLEDQAIFGPIRDFECACEKYHGEQHRNLICHVCGVKVTTCSVRRQRFGHFDLPKPITHPIGLGGEQLSVFPVLPASFLESPSGEDLAALYDALLKSSTAESPEQVADGLRRLIHLLVPALTVALEWDLHDANTLAWGLALDRKVAPSDGLCQYCGYPLSGLNVTDCPGCQHEVR